MNRRGFLGLAGMAVVGTAAAACSAPAKKESGDSISTATSLNVMWNQPFYSYNNVTAAGNATANTNIIYLTNDAFTYYDTDLNLVANKGFGTYEKVSDGPTVMKLTLAETAKWSDGTPVSAADIMLAWGAQSTLFNNLSDDEAAKMQNEDGTLKKSADGKVYFDSAATGMDLITKQEVGDDNKSVTFTFSKDYADWDKILGGMVGLPAHIVGKRALGESDPTKAAEAVLKAFQDKDNSALSKIANVWNSDWNFSELPSDADLLVCNGPYQITEFKKDQYLTVKKRADYAGEHKPSIDTITIRYNEDPMAAVQALKNDEVQIIQPQATADVLKSAQAIGDKVKVVTGDDATYEHVDLTMNNGGPFDPKTYGGDEEKAKKVRQAFLLCLPRAEIVEKIIKPLNSAAVTRDSYTVVPGSPSYDDTAAANGLREAYGKVDIAKAKALLAEAGASAPKVRLLYAQKNVRRIAEFQLIQASAKQAGFQVIDNGNPDWGKKLGDGTYDASLFGWQSSSTAVTSDQANYQTKGQNNFGGYNNPKVNELYKTLESTTDPAKQKEINIEVEKHLVEDAFGAPIFQFPNITAYSTKVEGVSSIKLSPTVFWNFWEWKVNA